MTIALHLATLVALIAVVALACRFYVPRRVAAAENDRDRHLCLAESLSQQLAAACAREQRASAEADALRAELEARSLAPLLGETVVVITKDGQTIEGDLVRIFADGLRLDHARYLSDRGQEIAGSVILRHEDRSWIQHRDDPSPPASAERE